MHRFTFQVRFAQSSILALPGLWPEGKIIGLPDSRQDAVEGSLSKRDRFLFTSESVTEGHPDKIADQISDAILDACLAEDPFSRVACETLTCTGLVVVAGEITSKAHLDVQSLVRETIRNIGYDDALKGFDCNTCSVISALN